MLKNIKRTSHRGLLDADYGKSGFTLVEVLITMGLMSAGAVMMAGLTNVNLKSQKGIQKSYDVTNLVEDVRSLLGNKTACLNSFNGMNPTGTVPVTQLVDSATVPVVVYKTGPTLPDNTIKLSSMSLGQYDAPTNTATLTLNLDAVGESFGSQKITRTVSIGVTLDVNNKIVSCMSRSRMTDGIWRYVSGASGDIFYSDGNVGVKTTTPQGQLHVNNDLDQGKMVLSGASDNQTYAGFYLANETQNPNKEAWVMAYKKNLGSTYEKALDIGYFKTDSTELPVMQLNPNGNVGVGTQNPLGNLHVNNATSEGSVLISGASDSGATYSALVLGNQAALPTQDSWYVGYKKDQGLPSQNQFQVGHFDSTGSQSVALGIKPTGDMGIGTQDPKGKLHVHSANTQGMFVVSGLSDGMTYSGLYLATETGNPTTDAWFFGYKKDTGATWAKSLQLSRYRPDGSGADTFMQVSSGGNVGIGLNPFNPTYTLHVTSGGAQAFGVTGDSTLNGNLTVSGTVNLNGTVNSSQPASFSNLNVSGTITASSVTTSSDRRLKENIEPLKDALDSVLAVQGVTYQLKSEHSTPAPHRHIGFIAQDLEKVLPELVMTDANGMKSVNYGGMSAVLVEAMKKLKADSDSRIQALEKENQDLKKRLELIERRLAR